MFSIYTNLSILKKLPDIKKISFHIQSGQHLFASGFFYFKRFRTQRMSVPRLPIQDAVFQILRNRKTVKIIDTFLADDYRILPFSILKFSE